MVVNLSEKNHTQSIRVVFSFHDQIAHVKCFVWYVIMNLIHILYCFYFKGVDQSLRYATTKFRTSAIFWLQTNSTFHLLFAHYMCLYHCDVKRQNCFSLNLPIVLTSAGHHVMGRNDHQISWAIAVYVGLHSTREYSVFYYSNWGFEIFKMCEILQI